MRWIAPDPHEAARLLVGIELGGQMYSDDGGPTFADHRPGAQPDVHTLAWHATAPGRAYEAGGGGAAWSHDGGMSWQPADQGRDPHYVWADGGPGGRRPLVRLGGAGRAQGSRRPGRRRGAVPLGGRGPLASAHRRAAERLPYALATTAGRELVVGLGDGRIWRSRDRGESWEEARARADAIVALSVTDPA